MQEENQEQQDTAKSADNSNVNAQNTPPKPTEMGLVELAKKREEEIEKKKKTFNKIMFFVKITLLVLAISFTAYIIYLKTIPNPPTPEFKVEEKPEPEPEPKPQTEWTQYRDDGLKIFVKYPPESKLMTIDTPAKKLEIVYDSTVSEFATVTEDNLNQGYIFRVTPLNIGIRTIDSITEIKRDSFKSRCPTSAIFSNINKLLIDTVDARMFDIKNCNSDYSVTYVPRFGIYYEIAQIYKGDFGVRQKYQATTDEILQSFKFFPDGDPLPEEPFKTYIDEELKFLFIHPNLNDTCCDIQAPPAKNFRKKVVLAKPDTYKNINEMDGVGVFVIGSLSTSFEEFMSGQKQLLTEDYRVVMGKEPESEDRTIKVGKYDGIMLKGYSWRGTNYVYLLSPAYPTKRWVVIFAIKSTNDEFEKVAEENILSTFEVF